VAALGVLSQTINSGSMGSLSGQTWVLDEFSSTAKELDEKTRSDFWGMALTGFAKQGGRVRFIVHHKTAKANGIPGGEAETFKAEVKMFWTDRTEMTFCTYQPSGQYELLQEVNGYYKESGQTFQILDWLLTETNPAWHNAPCPVRSLLTFFPEFDTRKGAIAHPLNESKPKDPFSRTAQIMEPQDSADPWKQPSTVTDIGSAHSAQIAAMDKRSLQQDEEVKTGKAKTKAIEEQIAKNRSDIAELEAKGKKLSFIHNEETAEANESYTMPEDPTDRVKLAARLVQELGGASSSEIDELVPGLSKYLPTVALFYSECTRKGEVYKWAS